MKIAIRSYGDDSIDGFGGGEQRWLANLAHFLRTEGHEIHRLHQQVGCDSSFDIYLDAAWEDCHRIPASVPHVHFSYFGGHDGIRKMECFQSGKCNLASPYRDAWVKNAIWAKQADIRFTNICVPQPYPDDLLPEHSKVPGFERQEIFWATKDNFHPNFASQKRPDGRYHVFVQGGLDTLSALLRLEKKVDFKMNFLLAHHLQQAPPELGVLELVNSFKNKEFRAIAPWTQLVDILARCKLNVPIGGLWGSIPETIFAKSLPLIFPRNQFSERFGSILPFPEDANEEDIYQALETLWFDKRIYDLNYEYLQDLFKEHRTDGLRRAVSIMFDQIGVR